ncbi:MAG: hypothetical protein IPJ23_19270 [Ignavibacteriales bacterium]|nr:hypothetical protein [Ignavibacteriales bacterium]
MEELLPSEYYLGQNFPNPFNKETKIKYCLPVKSNVKLSLYNYDGDIVKELVNDIKEAGTYEIILESSDFTEGKYYYLIEALDLASGLKKIFNEKKQIILIK